MSSSTKEALERIVRSIEDLPAPSPVVQEVLRLTEDAASAMADISNAIQKDPALAAKILKVSNSAYYGMSRNVSTIKLALVILGIRQVRNIVLGIALFESIAETRENEPFRKHSLAVAALSKKTASSLALGLEGEDFVAGLLHDLGKMVLSRRCGPTFRDFYKNVFGASLCERERNRFGFDHCDVAAALALRWNLPQDLVDAMACHHANPERPLAKAAVPKLAAVVRIANLAVHDHFDAGISACASCVDEEAWAVLGTPRTPATPEQRHAFLEPLYKEVADAPDFVF